MAKPEFKSISPFKVPSEAVNDYAKERNIPETVFPQSKPAPVKAVAKETAPSLVLAKLSIDVPEDVMYDIKQKALDERRSIRSLVLHALKQYGIEVREEDLVDDGRKRSRSAS
jgi:hypothetical protein